MTPTKEQTIDRDGPHPCPSIGAANILAWMLLVIGVSVSIFLARRSILDDTYIHLRYARNFDLNHRVEYNPGQPSSGSSSILYMLTLATVGRIVPLGRWPEMAKLISIVGYLAALALLILAIPKTRSGRRWILFLLAIAFMLAVPSAARWMQDGMETSWAVAFAVAAATFSFGWANTDKPSITRTLLAAIVISLPFLLRLDGAPTTAAAFAICFLLKPRCPLTYFMAAIVVALCGGWALLTYHLTGSIVPDTAIAKRLGSMDLHFAVDFLRAMASVSPLWLLGPIILVMVALINAKDRVILLGLIPIAAIIAAGIRYGQLVAGARYFLPQLAFAWALLMVAIARMPRADSTSSAAGLNPPRLITVALVLSIILGAAHALLISRRMALALKPDQFVALPELSKPGVVVLATDIGNLGWYTGAVVEDMSGLVNGRTVAEMPQSRRLKYFVNLMAMPQALMLPEANADIYQKVDPGYERHPGKIILHRDGGSDVVYKNTGLVIFNGIGAAHTSRWYLWRPEPMPVHPT